MKAEFYKRKLKNGMTIVMEKRNLGVVAVSISNRFGAANEDSEVKGIAHFIEHLVFTGTKKRSSEEISREIEKRGGILNAFTNNQMTSFWFKLPSEHLFFGLDVLTDMLKNCVFDKEKFEKERKVILEEIKMYHDDPKSDTEMKIFGNLYEKPFGEGILGSKETIGSLARDFVADYFKKHYSPENYVVSVVGECDFEKICEYFEKNYEREGKEIRAREIKRRNGETREEREGIDQANFVFAIHGPSIKSDDFYALEVLNTYLAGGMSSKLFLEIREKKGLAYTVRGAIEAESDYSYYEIYVGTTKEAVGEVKKLILQGFRDVEKMSGGELQEAKERLLGLKKITSEESTGVMNELAIHELTGKAEEYYEYEEKIKNVKLEQVKKLAKIKEYSTAAIVPK